MPSGDHDDRIAQDEADGGSSRCTKREADADFAGAAGDDEGHDAIEADQREQRARGRQSCRTARPADARC